MTALPRPADPPGPAVGQAPIEADVPILVVNDAAAQRLALRSVLRPLGYSIVEADSGRAALRCAMVQDFAVILLDVRMPEMDGFETAGLLRQRAQSEMTPIIFITSYGSDEIPSTDLYSQGAVDFIFAPVPPEEVRAKVAVFAKLYLNAALLAAQAREVKTSADQLRLLTDVAPIGIFQTDAANRYVYTNPRWTDILGVPPDAAAGQTWESIIGAESRAGQIVDVVDPELPPGEASRRIEIAVPGSPPRITLVTSESIPDRDGRTVGWVGTVADVTAEVGAEAAMADARDKANDASRLKSDFLANMSHEIRTPMNGVIGMTDLLLETDLDSRQRDYAQTVRNSGEALLTIINDILDFSKVEAGKLQIEAIEFDVQTIVDGVVDLLAGPAQAKGLELVAVVERSVPAIVTGDPGRVRQVLTNLIGNAIKFTPTGEIVVRVTEAERVDGDAVLRFEVSDTGDGIAAEKLALVFQPFVQADTSTSRKYGGTGLGLSISSHLVSLMGGDCGVSSWLGEGSTFWFTIQVHADADQSRDDRSADPALADVRALVVDDNGTQRRVLSRYLTDWGMSVIVADSGPAALAELRAAVTRGQPFAVAILDRSMPGMDGLDLKNAIAGDPDLHPAVVLMIGLRQARELGPAGELGVGACMSKPIHIEELRTCVRVALGLDIVDPVPLETASSPFEAPTVGRLLLAEDNLINQKVAVAMLTGAGYEVDTAPNGAAALDAAAAQTYDAILMDCQMPEMNGYEAAATLRIHEGSTRHTPIIAMTAGARQEDRERCRAAGMDSYLSKPLSKDALLALVAQSVRNGRALASAMARTSPPDEEITIDPVVVGELRGLGEEAGADFLSELVLQFVDDTDLLLAELQEAISAGDAPAVGRIAHTIKGSCGQLGGRQLAASCDRLERHAACGRLAEGRRDLHDINLNYDALRRSWAEQLASESGPGERLDA